MAESVPDGPSVRTLTEIAHETGAVVMAGLIEKDEQGKLYNCYVAVSPDGFLAKHRKLHTFVNPHLSPGDRFTVVEILGIKCGFLICYDNNLAENVRVTTLMGAEVIFMPHVTGCLPSIMPGRGSVDSRLWDERHRDPVRLRLGDSRSPKGKGWLMRWLPARASGERGLRRLQQPDRPRWRHDQAGARHDPRPIRGSAGGEPGPRG